MACEACVEDKAWDIYKYMSHLNYLNARPSIISRDHYKKVRRDTLKNCIKIMNEKCDQCPKEIKGEKHDRRA